MKNWYIECNNPYYIWINGYNRDNKISKEVMIMNKKSIAFMLILILVFTSIVGCSEKKDVDKSKDDTVGILEPKQETLSENDEEKIMKEFKAMVKSDNEPYTLVKFIDANIGNVTKEHAIEMIMELEEVQGAYIERYTDQLFMEEHQMELLTLSEVNNNEAKLKIICSLTRQR